MNFIIFTHVDEARKANLHAYKRIPIRPAIYESGLSCVGRKSICVYLSCEKMIMSGPIKNLNAPKFY